MDLQSRQEFLALMHCGLVEFKLGGCCDERIETAVFEIHGLNAHICWLSVSYTHCTSFALPFLWDQLCEWQEHEPVNESGPMVALLQAFDGFGIIFIHL